MMADALKPFEVILFPLITEKAVGIIEKENKLSFIVNQRASKADIKGAVEKLYKVKVDKVRTIKDLKGRKKAIVQINKDFKAQDIAMRLGVI